MRFILAVIVIAILALIGLYAYSWTLKPETRIIEQDAVARSGDA